MGIMYNIVVKYKLHIAKTVKNLLANLHNLIFPFQLGRSLTSLSIHKGLNLKIVKFI